MTYIIEVFAYQRLQVTCSNFKIAVSSPILPGETGLSDILMIYSKEFLSGIAWKGYLLHAGPYMRRNGWMVGIQLETLGPFERSYSFSFSRPALVNVKCSGRAMWLSQWVQGLHTPCCPMKTLGDLSAKKTKGPPLKTWQKSPSSPTLASRQNQGNYMLSRHLWCRDSGSTWLKQPQLPASLRPSTTEAQLGKSSCGGSWTQRKPSTVEVNILVAWRWADSKEQASIRLGFLLLYTWLLPPWACPM